MSLPCSATIARRIDRTSSTNPTHYFHHSAAPHRLTSSVGIQISRFRGRKFRRNKSGSPANLTQMRNLIPVRQMFLVPYQQKIPRIRRGRGNMDRIARIFRPGHYFLTNQHLGQSTNILIQLQQLCGTGQSKGILAIAKTFRTQFTHHFCRNIQFILEALMHPPLATLTLPMHMFRGTSIPDTR